jgi:lipoyl(octanoyl) transferase
MTKEIIVRWLGYRDYTSVLNAMRQFTMERGADQIDEIWLLEHPPVFTLGLAGKTEHILDRGAFPVVQSDRGGQVTYHGPGQLLAYTLFDLQRSRVTVRQWVSFLENTVIDLLANYQLQAYAKPEAPGVYIGAAKIAALGLRIKKACCYHGLSLNVAMDLEPFTRINPCGFAGLEVIDMASLGPAPSLKQLGMEFTQIFSRHWQGGVDFEQMPPIGEDSEIC